MIEVSLFRVKLTSVHRTGISLIKFSHQLISHNNLTYETNDPPENMMNGSLTSAEALIKFEIIKLPEDGVIQKKLPDKWTNITTYFTQRQVNRGKIRYLHTTSNLRNTRGGIMNSRIRDVIRLRPSYANVYSKDFDFVITFVPPELRCIANHELVFEEGFEDPGDSSESETIGSNITPLEGNDLNNNKNLSKKLITEAIITSDHLTHDTIPSSCDPNRIIYTLLSLPSLGIIYLTNQTSINSMTTTDNIINNKNITSRHHHHQRHQDRKVLSVGSFFTQESINQRRLWYKRKTSSVSLPKKSSLVREDSFDFEVTTELGQTNVIVSSFRYNCIFFLPFLFSDLTNYK